VNPGPASVLYAELLVVIAKMQQARQNPVGSCLRSPCVDPDGSVCGVSEVYMLYDLQRWASSAYGIMIIRVSPPALSHLRPALRVADPARPVIGIKEC
jgi:hypothetical protein